MGLWWHADPNSPGVDPDTEYDWNLDESVAADAYDENGPTSPMNAEGPVSAAPAISPQALGPTP